MPQNILLVWIGKIGDFVVSTSFIRALRKRYPDANITVVLSDFVAELAHTVPELDRIIVFPKKKIAKNLFPFLGTYFGKKWDLCIDLNPSRSTSAGWLTRLSGAKRRVSSFNENCEKFYTEMIKVGVNQEHMLEIYKQFAEYFDAGDEFDYKLSITFTGADMAAAGKIFEQLDIKQDEKFAIVHPGNFSKPRSCWAADKFAALTAYLTEHSDFKPVFISGPGESEKVRDVISQSGVSCALAPNMPLPVLAAFLSKASMFIGNSTGTLHIAEAVGVPTLSFNRAYSYDVWRPITPKSVAIKGPEKEVGSVPFEEGVEGLKKLFELNGYNFK
jgi:ADP-heptose:LPS heptosyltransferase